MDIKEYIDEQLRICESISAETATFSFETEGWMFKIVVKKKTKEAIVMNDKEEEYPVTGLYVEETVCPYPDRECCDGCPRYIEDENLCDLEL